MPEGNEWLEPRTLVSIGSLLVGLMGLLFGLWNRRESRLTALSKILEPLVRSVQALNDANNARRTREQLIASFTGQPAPDAVEHAKMLMETYTNAITTSRSEFQNAEAGLASTSFRFPDRVSQLVKTAILCVSEFGRLVNEGLCDKAELQLAKFRDDYRQIQKYARGWRLADPLEWVRGYFRRSRTPAVDEGPYELSEKEMGEIMELVQKRATTQADNTFVVHPPQKLLDDPAIAKSEKVIEELDDSAFLVVFQDGTTKLLSLVELLVFLYNLIVLRNQHAEISRMVRATGPSASVNVKVKFAFSITDIMRPEMAKALLAKVEFSKIASDGPAADGEAGARASGS
ncbi:MAG TPA: hypothetical protein VHD36_05545 [Pirellulales bacterium]|nr:hypothetical protein [Pirellulales bacterium]